LLGAADPLSFPPAMSWSSDPLLSLSIISPAAMPSFFTHLMLPPSSGWLPRERRHVQAAYGHRFCLRSPPSFPPLSRALACASAGETRDRTSHWSHTSLTQVRHSHIHGYKYIATHSNMGSHFGVRRIQASCIAGHICEHRQCNSGTRASRENTARSARWQGFLNPHCAEADCDPRLV